MTQMIKVEPYGKDWRMRSDALEEMTFHSGAAAEAAARLLANASAKAGKGAEVQIFLRDGSLAGRLPYPPAPIWTPERAQMEPQALHPA